MFLYAYMLHNTCNFLPIKTHFQVIKTHKIFNCVVYELPNLKRTLPFSSKSWRGHIKVKEIWRGAKKNGDIFTVGESECWMREPNSSMIYQMGIDSSDPWNQFTHKLNNTGEIYQFFKFLISHWILLDQTTSRIGSS